VSYSTVPFSSSGKGLNGIVVNYYKRGWQQMYTTPQDKRL
jgi:hypothetical protein